VKRNRGIIPIWIHAGLGVLSGVVGVVVGAVPAAVSALGTRDVVISGPDARTRCATRRSAVVLAVEAGPRSLSALRGQIVVNSVIPFGGPKGTLFVNRTPERMLGALPFVDPAGAASAIGLALWRPLGRTAVDSSSVGKRPIQVHASG
jgi:hypothetical protein